MFIITLLSFKIFLCPPLIGKISVHRYSEFLGRHSQMVISLFCTINCLEVSVRAEGQTVKIDGQSDKTDNITYSRRQ